MGAAEAVTAIALAAAAVVLAWAAWTDLKQRRIPNASVLALGALWLAWRVALGAVALAQPGASATLAPQEAFATAFLQADPFGLPSVASSLVAAAVFGGGLLAFALAWEAVAKREALGGGDVKLMAALALFLGPGRSAVCLLVACVVALAGVAAGSRRRDEGAAAAAADGAEDPGPGGAPERPPRVTFPFGPALAIGAVIALMPGTSFFLVG